MCFACDSTDQCAGDLKCPKLAPKSRAAIQKRSEFSDGNKDSNIQREQLRELLELRNEKKAHFRMLGDKASAADMGETRALGHEDNWVDEDKEDGFAAAAIKSFECLGIKCATTCACNAIRSLSQAIHVLSVSNSALLSKSVRPKILARASILRTNNTVIPQQLLL